MDGSYQAWQRRFEIPVVVAALASPAGVEAAVGGSGHACSWLRAATKTAAPPARAPTPAALAVTISIKHARSSRLLVIACQGKLFALCCHC